MPEFDLLSLGNLMIGIAMCFSFYFGVSHGFKFMDYFKS